MSHELPNDTVRLRSERDVVAAAWTHFARTLHPWTHIVHLTFEHDTLPKYAENEFRRFTRRLEQAASSRVDYLGTVENGPLGGRVHIHALLAGTEMITPDQIDDLWPRGRTEVHAYDAARGSGYTVKSVRTEGSILLLRDRPQSRAA